MKKYGGKNLENIIYNIQITPNRVNRVDNLNSNKAIL